MKKWLKLFFFLYLFILSIEIIKRASMLFEPTIRNFIAQNITPIKAICIGWFTTSVAQSSGAVGSVVTTFTGNGILNLPTAIYILIGASLGSTFITLLISLIVSTKKRRDFRHGFEIGLCYSIYSVFLIVIVFFLEYFFKFFSRTSLFIASILKDKIGILQIPNIVEIITSPIISLLSFTGNHFVLLFLGFVALILALRFISKSIIEVLGGEEKARDFIDNHFNSKYKTYFIGFLLTAIVFSSGITIGLLVPLAASRLIGLRRSIPFILGADLGTFTDIFLASLIVGETNALATAIAFSLFAIVGALIFLPNTNILFKTTKYVSKKLMRISRKKALYLLIAFLALPLVVILFF